MTRSQLDGLEIARRLYAPPMRPTRERQHVYTYGGETTLAKEIYRKSDGGKTIAPWRPVPEGYLIERLPVFGIKGGWHTIGTRYGRRCYVRLDDDGWDDPSRWPHRPAVWLPGWRPHLYRIDEAVTRLAEKPDTYVLYPEGEKDADTLINLGFVAVASYWGAGTDPSDTELLLLKQCHVVILADNDDAGRRRAERLAPRLATICASVRTITFDDLPKGGDVTDWIEQRAAEVMT